MTHNSTAGTPPAARPAQSKRALRRDKCVRAAPASVLGHPAAPATGYFLAAHRSAIDDSDQPFALWVPTTYTPRRSYPLVVALHGTDASERMIPEECFQIHRLGFREDVILLSPLGRGDLWFEWMAEADLWESMRWVKHRYRVDARRQYLTGLSMGGFACWRLACAYPEQWAAIAPVCGGGQPSELVHLKNLPVWCVHGQDDPDVPVRHSREMVRELARLKSPHRYDELPGWGHNSWEWIYNPHRRRDSLIDWFLRFRKRSAPPPILSPRRRHQFKDVFSEPMIISYPAATPIPHEIDLLRAEADRIAQFRFGDCVMRTGRLTVKQDTALTKTDLKEAGHLMIGRTDNHCWLRQAACHVVARHLRGRLQVNGQVYLGKTLVAATSQPSPWNPARLLAVIAYQQYRQLRGLSGCLLGLETRLGRINLFDTQQKRFILQQ